MRGLPFVALVAATAASVLGLSPAAKAAEGGAGFYLLGSRGPLAGVTPPPGVYFQDDNYYYSGDTSAAFDLEGIGSIGLGVDADIYLNLPTVLWVTPWEVLGGNLGFSGTLVLGGPDISATITQPPIGSASDSIFTFGDPLAAAFIGWHYGDVHWQTGVSVNFPIGDYDGDALANAALNYWAADVYGAVTWLNPNTGFELSGAGGVTFNAENPDSNYQTGTELHLEGAIVQHFSPAFDVGLVGYYYNQLTADSGPGVPAVLGGYEGRVAALGATVGLNFPIGGLPVSTRLKYYHEFDAKNRLEGDAVYFTFSMPLWVPPQ